MQTYFVVHRSKHKETGKVAVGTSMIARNDSIASMRDIREIEDHLAEEVEFAGRHQVIVINWRRFEDRESFL